LAGIFLLANNRSQRIFLRGVDVNNGGETEDQDEKPHSQIAGCFKPLNEKISSERKARDY